MPSLKAAVCFGIIGSALLIWPLSPMVERARAEGELLKIMTPADRERLDKFAASRKKALEEARSEATKQDFAILDRAFAGEPLSLHDGFNPTGEWRCRIIKLGKEPPLVVYGWFNCRITDDGAGWFLEKLNGSQRTSGRFYDKAGKQMIYLGVMSVSGDQKVRYGAIPERN